jgi:hypothetical protein
MNKRKHEKCTKDDIKKMAMALENRVEFEYTGAKEYEINDPLVGEDDEFDARKKEIDPLETDEYLDDEEVLDAGDFHSKGAWIQSIQSKKFDDEKKYVGTLFGGYTMTAHGIHRTKDSKLSRCYYTVNYYGVPQRYRISIVPFARQVSSDMPILMEVSPQAIILPRGGLKRGFMKSKNSFEMEEEQFFVSENKYYNGPIREIPFTHDFKQWSMFNFQVQKRCDADEMEYACCFRLWILDLKDEISCYQLRDINFYFHYMVTLSFMHKGHKYNHPIGYIPYATWR